MNEPLVLLHGFLGSPASWDDVGVLLGTRREVVRETIFGHAPMPLPREEAVRSFDDEVDRLAGRLRAARITRAHLCGYSLGARVALGLLARHGDLFSRATLIGVNPGLRDEVARAARAASDERWARLLRERGLEDFLEHWEAQALFATQARLPEAVRERQRELRLRHRPEGLAAAMELLGLAAMPDRRASLALLAQPVCFVVGAEDARFETLARECTALTPSGSLRRVLGAGHNVALERPDLVAELLLSPPGPAGAGELIG